MALPSFCAGPPIRRTCVLGRVLPFEYAASDEVARKYVDAPLGAALLGTSPLGAGARRAEFGVLVLGVVWMQ